MTKHITITVRINGDEDADLIEALATIPKRDRSRVMRDALRTKLRVPKFVWQPDAAPIVRSAPSIAPTPFIARPNPSRTVIIGDSEASDELEYVDIE